MDPYTKEKIATADALDKASTALEHEARRLRIIANSHRECAAGWQDHSRSVATAPHLVEWLKRKGSNDPIAQAAELMDTFPGFTEAHYKHFVDAQKFRTKRLRDREIVRRARTQTNGEIAAYFKLSVSTIQRVLKESDLGRYAKPKIKMEDLAK